MNWTSTQVPMWQIDCVEFHKVGLPFELRDINSEEHETFAKLFALRNNLHLQREGKNIRFISKQLSREASSTTGTENANSFEEDSYAHRALRRDCSV
jgi:hypothetical protein